MPDPTAHDSLSSVKLDPFPLVIGTEEERIEWFARHADQEILYDRPYEDRKKVRVTGPSRSSRSRRTASCPPTTSTSTGR